MRINMPIYCFTCHPQVYPQLELATLPLLSSPGASSYFGSPTEDRKLSWPGFLHLRRSTLNRFAACSSCLTALTSPETFPSCSVLL